MNSRIIAITKSEGLISKSFITKIKQHRSDLIVIKTSRIVESDHRFVTEILDIISKLDSGYVIFLSSKAVTVLFNIAFKLNRIDEFVQNINQKFIVVAIGPSTRDELQKNRVIVNYMPDTSSSKGVIDLFSKLKGYDIKHDNNNTVLPKIIIPRSLLANDYLKIKLSELGFRVQEFFIYHAEPAEIDNNWLNFFNLIQNEKIDSLIFTSPSNVNFLFDILKKYSSDLLPLVYKIRLILSIGPLTSQELMKHNIPFIESKNHTLEGIFEELYKCDKT
ncbi:MAG TPA: uroporphyrinogen-III synthase [Nitrososphaeraceae archaeon]|nr:uroporphyrinogen-III synthase [Nitrososphaeraceae archaeon]